MGKELSEGKFVAFRHIKLTEAQPDYIGQINENGVIKQIVAWVKKNYNGDQFLSGAVNEERQLKADNKGNRVNRLSEGKFVAFRNTKFTESQPDYIGQINENGVIKRVDIWIENDRDGNQFISGVVNEVEEIRTDNEGNK